MTTWQLILTAVGYVVICAAVAGCIVMASRSDEKIARMMDEERRKL